jgi:hypothetical protein
MLAARVCRAAVAPQLVKSVEPVTPGVYRHYKNKLYLVLGFALHTETNESMVHYRAMYRHAGMPVGVRFVRPIAMFTENIEHQGKIVPRFERVTSLPKA